jgi:rfaE bifunctional protein kinase chain/domain
MISIAKKRFDKICGLFANKKVMIIGDLMIDEYLIGRVNRISPEAPVPIIEIREEILKFGGAANVAANIQGLGCIPFLVGSVGEDRNSDIFMDMVVARGMASEGIIHCENRPTTIKTRIIGQTQHIARVDRECCGFLHENEMRKIITIIRELIGQMDAIILEDYNKGLLSEIIIKEVIELANRNHKIITVDPKFVNFMCYKNVTVFKPNLKEIQSAMAITIQGDKDLYDAGKRLLRELQAENILITRGADGMTLFEKNGRITHVPTNAWHVADVSGAGDTVISTLTAAIAGGATIQEAATLANYAAGIVCREVGVVPITLSRLREEYLGTHSDE